MSWSEVVAGRLTALGFQTIQVGEGVAYARQESWGSLWVALAKINHLDDAEAYSRILVTALASASEEERIVGLLVFPFARVPHEQVEALQRLRQADVDGRWTLIPWVVETDAELVNQHTGWPTIDPRVAAALADPVPVEKPAVRLRPVAEEPQEREDERPGEVIAATNWGRQGGNRFLQRLGLGGNFPVTRLLLALNICVYLAMALLTKEFISALVDGPDSMTLYHFGANITVVEPGIMTTFDQPWRLLTSTFLHGGVLHIAFNMYALWNTGRFVEMAYGSRRMLYIYLTSGVIGSIATVLLRTDPMLGVGASGAIMGLFGAIIYFALSLKGYKINWQPILMPVIMTLAFGFMVQGVDNWAHIGGLVGGVVASFIVGAPGDRPTWKSIAAGALGALLVALLLKVIPLVPLFFNPKG